MLHSSYSYAGLCSSFLLKLNQNPSVKISPLDSILPAIPGTEEIAEKLANGMYNSPDLKTLAPVKTELSQVLISFKKQRSLLNPGGNNNNGIYTLETNTRKYFAKLFKKEDYLYLNGSNKNSHKLGYQKLISDLGWGPHFYSLIIDGQTVVGIITEHIEGNVYFLRQEDSADRLKESYQDVERKTWALESVGIIARDMQFILNQESLAASIIDVGDWTPSISNNRLTAKEIEAFLNKLQ